MMSQIDLASETVGPFIAGHRGWESRGVQDINTWKGAFPAKDH